MSTLTIQLDDDAARLVREAALQDRANELHLSHASLWEMRLKHQKGKLLLRKPLAEIIEEQCPQNGLR